MDQDRLALARAFSYSAGEGAAIAAVVQSATGRRPPEQLIQDIEEVVREYLCEYVLFPASGKAARRRHFRAVAKAAAALHQLLDDPAALEGSSAAYLVNDQKAMREGFSSTVGTARDFTRAVGHLARRAEEWSRTGYLPGAEPGAEDVPLWVVDGNNNVRTRMAHQLLQVFRRVTGAAPTMTAGGPAALWLEATVNPAMKFAVETLGENRARCMRGYAAVETIGKVRSHP